MEHIIVNFPTQRPVFVDGFPIGETNTTISVNAGRHTINLGGPSNYSPRRRIVDVQNTNPVFPLSIDFEPTDDPGPT